jgi:type IX secretion system PorP/SprF family membrane protein
MKKLSMLFVLLSGFSVAYGQQEAQASMYFFNPLQFNSAYAGTRGSLNVTAVSRAQWVGWEGAPQTQFLSIHAPILRKKIGLGGSMVYDKIGARTAVDAMVNFAYHLQLNSKDLKLSFGASAGIQQAQYNFNGLLANDYSDLNYGQSNSVLNSNFGAGLYLHNNKFYLGASVPKLINRSLDSYSDRSFYQKHYFVMAGYVFNLNSVIDLKPSVLIKYTDNSPITADINVSAQFYKQFWIGALYRLHDAIGFNASYTIKDICMIGYAYDFPINGKLVNQWGSHEVVLSFDIRTKNNAFLSPRYF